MFAVINGFFTNVKIVCTKIHVMIIIRGICYGVMHRR